MLLVHWWTSRRRYVRDTLGGVKQRSTKMSMAFFYKMNPCRLTTQWDTRSIILVFILVGRQWLVPL